MKLNLYKIIGLVLSISLLTSCGPKEKDFKSTVPVVKIDKTIDENQINNNNPQDVTTTVPTDDHPTIPTTVPPIVPPIVEPIVPPIVIPSEINLDVTFFPQAPDANWDLPWQEACEEAASILAYYYATEKPLTKEKFKEDILGLVDWQNDNFGDYKHTNIAQTAEMIKGYFSFSDFQIIENPTIEQMKEELSKGHVIVAPFAGRQLGNPFYSGEGPLYHMMVIRGYDEKNFITNDVGTKRGENFIYPYNVIMSAMHEWHDTDMNLGAKKVIILN